MLDPVLDLLKKKREFEHVDLGAKLVEKGLAVLFPHQLWPDVNAVRKMATKFKARKKYGEANAFVCVDLKE